MIKYGNNKSNLGEFRKLFPEDLIWWIEEKDKIGAMLFSFDKETIFNFWSDYPQNLTREQKAIFDIENPELAEIKGFK